MKINKKIVQEVLSKEFGVKKESVNEVQNFRDRCYKAENGRMKFEAYYVGFDDNSLLEVTLDTELIATYEFIKTQGIVKIARM